MHQQIKQALHPTNTSHKLAGIRYHLKLTLSYTNVYIPNFGRRDAIREECGKLGVMAFGSIEAVLIEKILMCSNLVFLIQILPKPRRMRTWAFVLSKVITECLGKAGNFTRLKYFLSRTLGLITLARLFIDIHWAGELAINTCTLTCKPHLILPFPCMVTNRRVFSNLLKYFAWSNQGLTTSYGIIYFILS